MRITAEYGSMSWNDALDAVREFKLEHPEVMDSDIEIELNYDGCYYESDSPGIEIVWNKPRKKA